MTRAEYEKALELIRDNRDNVIEIAIGLNRMVTDDSGKLEKPVAKRPEKKKTDKKGDPGKLKEPGQQDPDTKKESGQQDSDINKESGQQDKKTWKPKRCEVCGEVFQPKNNRQMRCDKCKTLTVEQDTKNTAAELAAMSEKRK